MNNKQMAYVGVGILVMVAILVMVWDQPAQRDFSQQRRYIEQLDISAAEKVAVSRGERGFELSKNDKQQWWFKSQDLELPADGSKVARLFEQLMKLRPVRLVSNSAEGFAAMENPTRLRIEAKQSFEIELGESRDGGGQFASMGDQPEVFLMSEALQIDLDEDAWELKTILDVAADQVKSMETLKASSQAAMWSLERSEDSEKPWTLAGLKDGETVRSSNVRALSESLQKLNFSSRQDASYEPAKTALSRPEAELRFTLKDGRIYDLKVGKVGKDQQERYFVQIYAQPGEGSLSQELRDDLELLKRMMESYRFEVGAFQAKKWMKTRKDLVQQAKS